MKLNIQYSIDFEVERVLAAIKKFEWYKTNGYTVNLPESLDLSNIDKISNEDIKKAVTKEYDEENYSSSKKYIEDNWINFDEAFVTKALVTKLIIQDNYTIFLTRYGVGGSYNLPNTITINIKRMFEFGLVMTIAHETTHLLIQPLVVKYNVDHWVKERTVDLLLEQFAPKLNKFQQIPIDTQKIDEVFNKNYPDVELILKSLGSPE